MRSIADRLGSTLVLITSILIFCSGVLLMLSGVHWYWMILVFAFVVLLPVVVVLSTSGISDDESVVSTPTHRADDPVVTLRERYANGELTDEQFERKLDRLLRTETTEFAEDWIRER